MLALYATIWVALALFVAGETGRSIGSASRPPVWAWWAFTTGLLLALVHTALAFEVVHNWDHGDAVRAAAAQTRSVFGAEVGWGVYVNYVFYGVWLADAAWWRRSGDPHDRPAAVIWTLRSFYLVIILNAAVIFAAGPRRALGLVLVCWLTAIWSLRFRQVPASRDRR